MRFSFTIDVEVEREEGKFASRDELREQIEQAIEDANPDTVEGDNGGVYTVTAWDLSENVEVKKKGKP